LIRRSSRKLSFEDYPLKFSISAGNCTLVIAGRKQRANPQYFWVVLDLQRGEHSLPKFLTFKSVRYEEQRITTLEAITIGNRLRVEAFSQ
jgi:hypothetical protein